MEDYWDTYSWELLTEDGLSEQFDEYLDGCYSPVNVIGYEFELSNILKNVDPIAYREEFLSWVDYQLKSGNISEDDPNKAPWPYEAEEEAYEDLDL